MKADLQKNIINSGLLFLGLFLVVFSFQKLRSPIIYQQQGTAQLGHIERYNNDVRLKATGHFEWTNLYSDKSPVAVNDKIFSNKGSTAEIKFSVGHKLTLQENSLIRIKAAQEIKIEKGSISLDLAANQKPFVLIVGKKRIKVKTNKDSRIKVTHNENTSIEVQAGELEISAGSEVIALKQNEQITVADATPLQKLDLIFPTNEIIYTSDKTAPINFKISGLSGQQIELANDLEFTNAQILNPKELHLLAPGDYYWKVGDSVAENFKIIQTLEAPQIITPKSQETILVNSERPYFNIKMAPMPKRLPVLISITDEQKQLVQEEVYDSADITIRTKELGKYFVKAKIQGEYQSSPWSESRAIELAAFKFTEQEAVVIELKKPNQKVRFAWQHQQGELNIFEVAKDPNFTEVVVKKRIRSKNFTHVNFPVIGTYYWRAKKVGNNGSLTPSLPTQVIIRPTPPPARPKSLPALKLKYKIKKKPSSVLYKVLNLFFPSAYAAAGEPLTINFPAIADAKEYEIEIFKDESMSDPVYQTITRTNSFQWSPPKGGTYYYRLRFKDFWDRYSDYSIPSPLTIELEYIAEPSKTKASTPTVPVTKTPKAKPRKKTRPKQIKARKRLVKKIKKPKPYQHQLKVALGAKNIAFTQQSADDYEIDGNIYNSFELNYRRLLKKGWMKELGLDYETAPGKVYNSQDFALRSLALTSKWRDFALENSIVFKQISSYYQNGSDIQFDKLNNLINIGFKYGLPYNLGKKHRIFPSLGFLVGASTDYFLELNYDYSFKKQYSFSLNSRYLNSRNMIDDDVIIYQYIQLLAAISHRF